MFAKNRTNPIQPSSADFVDHFKETFHSKRPQDILPKSNEKGPLDYIISIKELEDASSKLKSGKSCGIDNICNEMIKSLVNTHPHIALSYSMPFCKQGK